LDLKIISLGPEPNSMIANDERIFVDTNVFLYAHDRSSERKREIARHILGEIWEKKNGLLSTQVLQELYIGLARKSVPALASTEVLKILRALLSWKIVVNSAVSVLEAIDIHRNYRLSFWDAMIVRAAIQGRAKILCSEDLADGQSIEGVRIFNPFRNGLKT